MRGKKRPTKVRVRLKKLNVTVTKYRGSNGRFTNIKPAIKKAAKTYQKIKDTTSFPKLTIPKGATFRVINSKDSVRIENPVCHPTHYNSHPSGIECIQVVRHMPANIAAAIKYLWRTDKKNGVEDLKKSLWYIADQIDLVEGNSDKPQAFGEYLKHAISAYQKSAKL